MKKPMIKAVVLTAAAACLISSCGKTGISDKKSSGEQESTALESALPQETENTASTDTASESAESSIDNAVSTDSSSTDDITIVGSRVTSNYDNLYMDSSAGIDTKLLAEGHYPSIALGTYDKGTFTEYKDTYKELSDALNEYNQSRYDLYKKNMDLCKEYAADDERFNDESGDFYGYYYTVDMDSSIQRSDSAVFSISEMTSTYMGGAHPFTAYTGYNIDSQTGKQLKISDIVTDKDAFIETVNEKLHEAYPDIDSGSIVEDIKQTVSDMYDGKDDINLQFYMDHDALEIMFSQYDLTCYAAGPEFISLYYKDCADLLNPAYTKTTRDFASNVDFSRPLTISSGDTSKTLVVSYEPASAEQYGSDCYELTIALDGREFKDIIEYTYNISAFVLSKDNKSYLYVDCTSDNDWEFTQVYDLNGDTAAKVDDFNDIAFYSSAPVDPSDFIMSTRGGVLSTYMLSCHYDLGNDGSPKRKTEYWWINSDSELTLNAPVTLSVMDSLTEDGSDNGTNTEILSGTVLKPVRTDNKSWVDALTPDGKYARIVVDTSDWPQKVNGTSIEELFDGIVFAG